MRSLLLSLLILTALGTQAQITLPANMFGDSTHAPYLWGVASGDPVSDGIVLWTKVDGSGTQSGSWELASDDSFNTIVQSGNYSTDDSKDQTVLIEVSGLDPGQFYWYRFLDGNSNSSVEGRTKTAPAAGQQNVRFAVASCSSVYSAFFNAYARIGERDDIDCVIHLGDYIYDFVDTDEQVRVPDPFPTEPTNLSEWRDRHEYYLLDPDLRLARQMHPWIVIWDNHDIDKSDPFKFLETVTAFREYVPMRVVDPNDEARIYRSFQFGDLIDLMVLDYEQYYHDDTIGNEMSAIGTAQRTWLLDQLSNSNSQWRIIGNQKMMGEFSVIGLPSQIPFGDGPVADSSAWDGHNQERTTILNHLMQNNIDNTVVLSGDIHMSFADDLPPDYGNYNSNNGSGSAAVEFIPTSISRGNFDEAGFGGFLATLAQAAISLANDHHVYSELESHGYGILDVRPERTVAEFWYSDKTPIVTTETFARGYQVLDGDNHWDRNALSTPTVYSPAVGLASPQPLANNLTLFPQPAQDQLNIRFRLDKSQSVTLKILEAGSGKLVLTREMGRISDKAWTNYILNTQNLASGVYLLQLQGETGTSSKKVLIGNQ